MEKRSGLIGGGRYAPSMRAEPLMTEVQRLHKLLENPELTAEERQKLETDLAKHEAEDKSVASAGPGSLLGTDTSTVEYGRAVRQNFGAEDRRRSGIGRGKTEGG